MRAMILERVCLLENNPNPLKLVDIPEPEPVGDEVRIQVSACGVCHTGLDEIEGRTAPARFPMVPGHEVVGTIDRVGPDVSRHKRGERVGVGWIHHSDGSERENLSDRFRATGRDVAGGYAEYMVVPQDYAYPIPDAFSDEAAAPLLCAGSVGYRALRLTGIGDGQTLGLTGFGGSGHLILQVARYLFPASRILVFARSEKERQFAIELGAHWAGDTTERPPEAPQAVIDTTPAWKPVLSALEVLQPGGRLVINAIRKEDADAHLMSGIRYEKHLWREKELKSVANVTARDIRDFLQIAAQIPLVPEVRTYPLEQANEALMALRSGHVRGAFVLKIT